MSIPMVGDELPSLTVGPLTLEQITGYAQASRDPNPIHTDEAIAKAAGYPKMFAQGMLLMAFFARQIVDQCGLKELKRIKVRFNSPTWCDETVTCRAKVVEVEEHGNKHLVTVDLHTESDDGHGKIVGSATFEA